MKICQTISSYYMRTDNQPSQSVMGVDVSVETEFTTSQIWAYVTLVLPIIGKQKVLHLTSPEWCNIHAKFHENLFNRSRVLCV
jgi:hypothetical protein